MNRETEPELIDPEAPEMSHRAAALLWLGLILIFAAALRHYRIDEPFNGYHAFNEAWYSAVARNFHSHPLTAPTAFNGAPDANVTPLFPQTLYFVSLFFGESEANFRMVSLLSSLAAAAMLFFLGARLFSLRAGLAAAALFAFTPVAAAVGRNVQPDSMCLALILAALYVYVDARPKRSAALHAAAGLLLGLAFMTKQFACLLPVALLLWELAVARGPRGLNRGSLWFIAAAAAPPLAWLTVSAAGGGALSTQIGLAGSVIAPLSLSEVKFILAELFWGASPAAAVLFAAGLASAAAAAVLNRDADKFLILIAAVVFTLLFVVFRFHSYYILFAVPFAALLAGEFLSRKLTDSALAVVLVAVCGLASVQTVSWLCGVKYQRDSLKQISALLQDGADTTVILSSGLTGNYDAPVAWHMPLAHIVSEKELSCGDTGAPLDFDSGRTVVLSYAGRPGEDFPAGEKTIFNKSASLYLLGRRIDFVSDSEFFFRIAKINVTRDAPGFRNGVFDTGYTPDFSLAPLPPGTVCEFYGGRIHYRIAAKQ